MEQSLWVAKTGLDAQQFAMRAITNNLANVNTVGFKRDRPSFESLMYQTERQPGGQSSEDSNLPTGLMLGTGVRTVAMQKNFSQGGVIQSDRQLDVMVEGRGFLQVLLPDGTIGYTRDGQLHPNADGELVTSSGYKLSSSITLPQSAELGSITIGSDGTVTAMESGKSSPSDLGKLELADFINPSGLQPIGENLYTETVSSGSPQTGSPGSNGLGTIRQNALEGSNVNVVEELVGLIETQRAYEMNSKAISAIDNMMQYTDQVL